MNDISKGNKKEAKNDLLTPIMLLGIGLGFLSFFYFVCFEFFSESVFPAWAGSIIPIILSLAATYISAFQGRKSIFLQGAASKFPVHSILMPFSLVFAFLISLTGSILIGLKTPFGQIDAITIWNLHAKLLWARVPYWKLHAIKTMPWWFHYDYPLLMPSLVAQGWQLLGMPVAVLPLALNLLFAFASAGLLYAALFSIAGRFQAWFATMALLAASFFFNTAVMQLADVPLAFYCLAAAVVAFQVEIHSKADNGRLLPRLLVLFGLMAGFMSWTKNEGLLYALAFMSSFVLGIFGDYGRRKAVYAAGWVLLGYAPFLFMMGLFKRSMVVSNDLLVMQTGFPWQALMDGARYMTVLKEWLFLLPTAGGLIISPLSVLIFAAIWGLNFKNAPHATRIIGFGLCLSLIGIGLVYVMTPHNLEWHLHTSLHRIFMQLWPVTLLLIASLLKAPESHKP